MALNDEMLSVALAAIAEVAMSAAEACGALLQAVDPHLTPGGDQEQHDADAARAVTLAREKVIALFERTDALVTATRKLAQKVEGPSAPAK